MGFSKFGKLLEGKGEGVALQLTMSMVNADTMSIMAAFRKGTEIIGVPLVVSGTYAEINAGFFPAIASYQAKIEGFQTNMEALDAQLKAKEEAKKTKLKEKGKPTTGTTIPAKPAAKASTTTAPAAAPTTTAADSSVAPGQQGLFATLSSKADAAIAESEEEEGEGFTESVETEAELEA